MKIYKKRDFPVSDIRRFLEPGPVVLVSSACKGERNIMTMGWHMVMEFVPSLVGCLISSGNHSYELVSRSKECVINIPTVELAPGRRQDRQLLGRRGRQVQEIQAHRASPAEQVKAPLIARMLRQSRMQAGRRPPARQIQRLHLRGGQGARGRRAEVPQDHPLPRRRHVHGRRPLAQSAPVFPPRDAVKRRHRSAKYAR